jgi:hypothetical protein
MALERACAHLLPPGGVPVDAPARTAELVARFENALRRIGDRCGPPALGQCVQGAAAAQRLGERGRWDLGEQLLWLSSIRRYVNFAHRISNPDRRGVALIGALLMVFADWLGRNLIFPQQMPAGVLATLIGGPYLMWLLRK